MKKYNYLLISVLFLLSNSVFAGEAFDGFFSQIGAGLSRVTYKLTTAAYDSGGSHFPATAENSSADNATASLSLGYSKSFSNNLNLGLTGFYIYGDQKGELTNSDFQLKLKNIFGLSLEPGYSLDPKTLVYIKLGYVHTDLNLSSGGQSANLPVGGYVYGFGTKHLIKNNMFIGTEISNYVFTLNKYNSINTLNPNFIFAGVNLGYIF